MACKSGGLAYIKEEEVDDFLEEVTQVELGKMFGESTCVLTSVVSQSESYLDSRRTFGAIASISLGCVQRQ